MIFEWTPNIEDDSLVDEAAVVDDPLTSTFVVVMISVDVSEPDGPVKTLVAVGVPVTVPDVVPDVEPVVTMVVAVVGV